ncbi:MAG: fibrobacter succinogenes major paralogous domain-containing protein [Bacteroidales bacterium]|nr:fibrobacter succinogenes major paralogous domain-containing protein [Bacteroidales bacterium]
MKNRNIVRLSLYVILAILSMHINSCKKDNENTVKDITDGDGNVYTTVTIGTQVWLNENLKTTRYRNGDIIGTTSPATLDIRGESEPKYQWVYNGNEDNAATYGRLYTWYVITDSRGLCPAGWHIPSNTEWGILDSFLGGGNLSGGKLKEAGTSHWLSPNIGADNSTGFTALPGGLRFSDGTFSDMAIICTMWSSSEFDIQFPYLCDLYALAGYLNRYYGYGKSFGFSVRCLKN